MTTTTNEPLGGAPIYTEAQALEAWICVRKNNHSIPDDALDSMKAVLLASTRQQGVPPLPQYAWQDEKALDRVGAIQFYTGDQMHAYAQSYASAQLARQQAPVGDSVDTPEFADRIAAWAACARSSDYRTRTDGARKAWTALITHITAWKDAQLARERQGQGGMHAAADYIDKKAEEYIRDHADSEHDTGATMWRYGDAGRDYYNSLVELAEELRLAAPAAQAQGEPVAIHQWRERPKGSFQPAWYDAPHHEAYSRVDEHYEARTVYLGPAPQADEVRDAAMEEAEEGAEILTDLIRSIEKHGNYSKESTLGFLSQLKQCVDGTIRALKRTTAAADNQKGGE